MEKNKKRKRIFKDKVSFGRTAYIASCGAEMLDAIEHCGLRLNGTGDGLVFTGYSELEEFVEDRVSIAGTQMHDSKVRSKTLWFLRACLLAIRESYQSAGFTNLKFTDYWHDEGGGAGQYNVESTDYEIGDVVFAK